MALYGSFFPIPKEGTFGNGLDEIQRVDLPGALVLAKEPIKINVGRKRVKVKVTNTGDRPIQVRFPPLASFEGRSAHPRFARPTPFPDRLALPLHRSQQGPRVRSLSFLLPSPRHRRWDRRSLRAGGH